MGGSSSVPNEDRLATRDEKGNTYTIESRSDGWSQIKSGGNVWDVKGNVANDNQPVLVWPVNGQLNQAVFLEYLELNDAGNGTQDWGIRVTRNAWAAAPMLNYSGIMSGIFIAGTNKPFTHVAYTDSTDLDEIKARKNVVFLMQDGEYVKMVQNDDVGTSKYFTGSMIEYEPSNWSSYNNAGTSLVNGYYKVDLTPGTSSIANTSWTPWWRAVDDWHGTLPTSALTQTISVSRKGRYLKIRPSASHGDGYLNFSQIVVKDARGNNIAKNKTVTATSNYDNRPASVIVDGTEAQRTWDSRGVWHTGSGSRHTEYVIIDFGKIHYISSITYYGRSGCGNCPDRTFAIRLELSTGRATTWRSQ
jgi:hypothetical protein